jgi:hypothetical protein
VTRLSGISPRAPTPFWEGLEDKSGGTFPNQGLYVPDRNLSTIGSAEIGMPSPYQLSTPERLASKEGRPHKAVTLGTFSSIDHLIAWSTPELMRRPQEKMSPPRKDLAKHPLQEPTRAPFTSLQWRAQGTKRGSLEDSETSPNTMKATNRPRRNRPSQVWTY